MPLIETERDWFLQLRLDNRVKVFPAYKIQHQGGNFSWFCVPTGNFARVLRNFEKVNSLGGFSWE